MFLKKYICDMSAATAVEYGLIAAGIALAIVSSVFLFGDDLQALYEAMLPVFDSMSAEVETGR